jgi:transcriptional regulator with XRE-family HTH domain
LKHLRSPRHRALITAIVEARKAAGLTQRQLAIKLGRSNSFVWKIEAGERRVDILEFVEIAAVLKVDPVSMFERFMKGRSAH